MAQRSVEKYRLNRIYMSDVMYVRAYCITYRTPRALKKHNKPTIRTFKNTFIVVE